MTEGIKKCKGVFFRYRENSYFSKNFSIEEKRSYRLLKSISCPGCQECNKIKEDISAADDIWDVIREVDILINGATYQAVFVSDPLSYDVDKDCECFWELRRIYE